MGGPKLPYTKNLKFDPSLSLSDDNFAQKLKDGTRMERRTKEKRINCVTGYPEALDFARFASAAYQDWAENESPSDYEERLNLPKGWKLLTTATNLAFKDIIYGYFGAAYWQPARRRVVIAHRGTVIAFEGMKFKNLDALRADLLGIVAKKYVKQMDAACTFADKIRDAVEKVELERQTTYEIFFTGHSLGAWLAQVTTFSLKYLTLVKGAFVKNTVEGHHAHTVVFDSPGCEDTIRKMINDLDVRYTGKLMDPANLDITSYLSSPNFVNCCNSHVGKLFRVYPQIASHDYVEYTRSAHNMDAILETFQTSRPLIEVVDWPQIKIDLWQWEIWKLRENILGKEYRDFFQFATEENNYDPSAENIKVEFKFFDKNDANSKRFVSVRYQTKSARTNECAFSVFNHYELEFIQRFQQLKILPNSLFEGEEISQEYKSKITENLNKLIINSEERTISCETSINIFRLISYVKTLLRLYPELNERARIALTDFEIRKQIYTDITSNYRREMQPLTDVLLTSDWPDFVHFLQNQMSICHVLAQCGTDSAMAKVLKVIETKAKGSKLFAFELRNLVTTEIFFHLTEFLRSSENLSEVLIAIECKAGSLRSEENFAMLKKLQREVNRTNAKLVLITDIKDNDQFNSEDYSVRHGGITWDELTIEAQTETTSKNLITFQGNSEKMSLQNFIRSQSQATNLNEFAEILDPETLMQFINGKDVFVGPKNSSSVDIYIPRKFKYNPYIKDEVFDHAQIDDVFVILDQNREGLEHLLSTISGKLRNYLTKHQIETVSSDEEFEELCRRNPTKNVHCLKLESKFLVWHKTKGRLNIIRANIRDESENSPETTFEKLEDASEKTLIISDAPGMGKSTVLAVLAEKMKERTPSNWVIRVNLNDCAKTLKDAIKINFNDNLAAAKFLTEQILPCSENSKLTTAFERKLFEKCLTTYGGIVLIFDAFDEISPDYEELIIKLLEKLRESRLEQFVLSTRPHTKEKLEDQLGTLSRTMAPFSRDDQKNFLIKFWEKRLAAEDGEIDLEKRAQEWVDYLKKSINTEDGEIDLEKRPDEWEDHPKKAINNEEGDFLGIPLQCLLLAEYTIDKIKGEIDPKMKELSLMDLYETYDSRKIEIYQDEKNSMADGEINARLNKGVIITSIRQSHREYALRLLLARHKWHELQYPVIEENRNDIETTVQKVGLMVKMGDNPQFLHRTFADFYVLDYILYLSRNSENNERKLAILSREILLEPEFGVSRILLDGLIRYKQKQDQTTNFLRSCVQIMAQNWTVDQTLWLNGNGDTILHVLLSSKNYSLLDALLKMLNEVIEVGPKEMLKSLIKAPRIDSLLALHIAASQGHVDPVRSLVNHGANVNSEEKKGITPLLAATRNGHLDVVRFLLENGADINSSDNDGWTPIIVASMNGDVKVVRVLFEKGADIISSDSENRTPMGIASGNGHLEVIRFLLEQGADIHYSDEIGWTPMIQASVLGHLEVVRFLFEQGANINLSSNNGNTPIIVASLGGHLELVRFLCKNGADVNCVNEEGMTPVIAASLEGHLEIVGVLFENGADINSSRNDRWTPIIASSPARKFLRVGTTNLEAPSHFFLFEKMFFMFYRIFF